MLERGSRGAPAGATNLRVVKIGGRAQEDPALVSRLVAAWNDAPGSLCIVHGGAAEIDRLQRALGGKPRFVGGRRVTSAEDIDTVRMALSGAANKRLVAALNAAGVPAVGVSGEDAAMLRATPFDAALGRVGRPETVRADLLRLLLAAGFLPVVAPLAAPPAGETGALNVNGDDAAAAIALALGARELFFVTDVEGVRRGAEKLSKLDAAEAATLLASGAAEGGMAVKVASALGALAGGTARVRIGGCDALADPALGTTLTLHGEET
ncbi:MAG TPA: acetylglutamate kinase [Gemmatimonadaceae bacterium]|nr:acetylglutamate kinase [Gemmatimonadaceae bacterium]